MGKLKESKWVYVVLALLISCILWLYVRTVVNPDGAVSRSVPVIFVGLDALEERGLMVSEGADQTVTLTVKGKSEDLYRFMSNENVNITINLSNITEPGTVVLTPDSKEWKANLPTTIFNNNVFVSRQRPSSLQFTISRMVVRDVEVRGVFTGSVAEGFQKGEFTITPSTIQIRGQEELVNQVDYAQVTVSNPNLNVTLNESMPFVFMGFNGQMVPGNGIDSDIDAVQVTLPVVKLKEVPLSVELVPGGGATIENAEVHIEPSSIMVSGGEDALIPLKEISLGSIELYKIFTSESFSFDIKLDPALTNVSGVTQATVTVKISGLATRALTVDNIELINIPDSYKAEAVTKSRLIQIRGSQEAVDAVIPSQIQVVADLHGRTAGSQTVPVKVYLNGSSDVGVVGGDYNITVSITQ